MERSYCLNDKVTVKFDPEDGAFIKRLYAAFGELERLQAHHLDGGTDHFLRTVRSMREILDSLFDVPICGPLFGDIRPGAPAGDSPLWRNLLCAVMSQAGIAPPGPSEGGGG